MRWGYSADYHVAPGHRARGWLDGDDLSAEAAAADHRHLQPAGHRRRRPALDALTAAERQVADASPHGLTSRKIAEELFVSPRTVDAHLTHIYRKLDINTRARLAALVMEQSQRAH